MRQFEVGENLTLVLLLGALFTFFMIWLVGISFYSNYNVQQETLAKIQICQQMITDQNRSNCLDKLK